MVDFDEIMSQDLEDVHRPPPLPPGTYKILVTGVELTTSEKKKTPGAVFTYENFEPQDDVDADLLKEFEEAPGGSKLSEFKMSDTQWLSPKSLPYVKENFFAAFGKTSGPLQKVIEDCKGESILVEVVQKVGDSGHAFNEVKSYAACD